MNTLNRRGDLFDDLYVPDDGAATGTVALPARQTLRHTFAGPQVVSGVKGGVAA